VCLFRIGRSLFNFPCPVSDDLASGNQASDFIRFVCLFRIGGSLFNFPHSVSDDLASGDQWSDFIRFVCLFRIGGSLFNFPHSVSDDDLASRHLYSFTVLNNKLFYLSRRLLPRSWCGGRRRSPEVSTLLW
jgi:hypothetical protein